MSSAGPIRSSSRAVRTWIPRKWSVRRASCSKSKSPAFSVCLASNSGSGWWPWECPTRAAPLELQDLTRRGHLMWDRAQTKRALAAKVDNVINARCLPASRDVVNQIGRSWRRALEVPLDH